MSATPDQHWDPAQYGRHARFVSDLGAPVVELLAPRPGERILDLGCGDGALTVRLVELDCPVVGVDASPAMVDASRARGLDARVMSGEALAFEAEFDAVFSNAALHWMTDAPAVAAGVARALRPGGRFVGEFGGHGNVAAIVAALEAALGVRGILPPRPWYFPRPEEYRRVLAAAGFEVLSLELLPRPTPLPGDIGGWLETFAQPYRATLPVEEWPSLRAEVVDALRGTLQDPAGRWHADYVRLRFAARKGTSSVR